MAGSKVISIEDGKKAKRQKALEKVLSARKVYLAQFERLAEDVIESHVEFHQFYPEDVGKEPEVRKALADLIRVEGVFGLVESGEYEMAEEEARIRFKKVLKKARERLSKK